MPTTYIPQISLTVAQAQIQYTRDGICRPWSGDALKRHEHRVQQARIRALVAEGNRNEVCS